MIVWFFPYSTDSKIGVLLFPIVEFLSWGTTGYGGPHQTRPVMFACLAQVAFYVWPIVWIKKPFISMKLVFWIIYLFTLNGLIFFLVFRGA